MAEHPLIAQLRAVDDAVAILRQQTDAMEPLRVDTTQRMTFGVDDRHVLKMSRDVRLGRHLMLGEIEMWHAVEDTPLAAAFAPIVAHDDLGEWLLMERVDVPLNVKPYPLPPLVTDFLATWPGIEGLVGAASDELGITADGRTVLFDYCRNHHRGERHRWAERIEAIVAAHDMGSAIR